MAEAKFKRPELTDQDLIDSYFKKYPSRSCDRTFANVYLWARFYEVEFAQYNNVLLFRDNSAGYGYAFPAGEDEDVKAAIDMTKYVVFIQNGNIIRHSVGSYHFPRFRIFFNRCGHGIYGDGATIRHHLSQR